MYIHIIISSLSDSSALFGTMSGSRLEMFWWIDCKEKSTVAGSPHHLEERMGNKLPSSALRSSCETAEQKRNRLLEERRRRLTASLQRVCEVRRSHQERQQRSRKRFRTNLEVRMTAAVACRERRLRSLVLSCAKEVNRAKSVASETKRRLQRLNVADACAFVRDQAAAKIQQWWRSVYVRSVLKTCRKTFPAQMIRIKPPSQFTAMQRLITSRATLKPSQILFEGLSKVNSVFSIPGAARVFLSAFAISHYPKMVLGQYGSMEMDLELLAAGVVQCFRLLLKGCHHNIDAFASLWQQYTAAFNEWKNADKQRLIEEVVGFWQQAQQLKQSILGMLPETAAHLEVIRDIDSRLQQLEQDLQRLGGEEALRALHSHHNISSSPVKEDEQVPFYADEIHRAPPTKEVHTQNEEEELQGAVEKMVLAHELTVNDSFKLHCHKPVEGSLEECVTDSLHRAFWDNVRQQLENDPPNYTQALGLLAEVKQALLNLVPPHHSAVRDEINEVLDLELIHQQAGHGILDISGYADFIVSILLRLCAPSRDNDVRSLLLFRDNIVELFKNMFQVLEQMKLDMANFQLQMLKPQLKAHAAEYEREKFQQLLESSHGDLSITRHWLLNVAVETGGSKQLVDNERVISLALAKLLFWSDGEQYPETWHLDVHRLKEMQWELLSLAALCACVTVASSSSLGQPLKRDKEFLGQLKQDLLCVISDCRQRSLKDVSANVAEQLKVALLQWRKNHQLPPPPANDVSSFFQLTESTFSSPQHPVFQLLLSRLQLMVEELVHVHVNAKVSNIRAPPGLMLCSVEVIHVVEGFQRLVQHNRNIFGPTYRALLEQLMK